MRLVLVTHPSPHTSKINHHTITPLTRLGRGIENVVTAGHTTLAVDTDVIRVRSTGSPILHLITQLEV